MREAGEGIKIARQRETSPWWVTNGRGLRRKRRENERKRRGIVVFAGGGGNLQLLPIGRGVGVNSVCLRTFRVTVRLLNRGKTDTSRRARVRKIRERVYVRSLLRTSEGEEPVIRLPVGPSGPYNRPQHTDRCHGRKETGRKREKRERERERENGNT